MDRMARVLAQAKVSTPAPAPAPAETSALSSCDTPPLPALVLISRIEAKFTREKQVTQQTCHIPRLGKRDLKEEQQWQRKEQLGRGGFGYVYLEQCTLGSSVGQVRAVKEIRKRKDVDYMRELEALATFSFPQVGDKIYSVENSALR